MGSQQLDVAASKIDGFLWSDICVSSGVLSRAIRSNLSSYAPGERWFAWCIPSKTNTLISWKQCSWCYCFLHTRLSWWDTCVSPNHLKTAIWHKMSLSPSCELWFSGSFPFKNSMNYTLQTMCLKLLLQTPMSSCREIHLYPYLSWHGLFGMSRTYRPLENIDFQEGFLSNLTQFSLCPNVLSASDSYTDGCPPRDKCVSWNSLKRPNWRKQSLSRPWNSKLPGSIPWKPPTILKEIRAPDHPASRTDGCLWRDTCVSPTQLNRPFCNNVTISPQWKVWFSDSIPWYINSILTGKQCSGASCF
jgi:hypothetical protein